MNKKEFTKAKINLKLTPGEMLRTLRELQGFSQAELAQKMGIKQSNISALETGARQIGRERALALANVLKVHPAVILFPDFDIRKAA